MATVKVVIGIDQSLTSAGVVALDLEGNIVYSQVIRTKPGPDRFTVLYEGYTAFFILMRTLGHEVVQILREHHAFGSEYGREAMGAAAAIADMVVWDQFQRGAPHADIQQVKKFAGNAKMKKDQMRLAVYKKWGAEFKSNDEVDAYVLARIARGLYVGNSDLAYEQEVLDKIKDNTWPPQLHPTSKSRRRTMDPSSESSPPAAPKRSLVRSVKPSTTAKGSVSGRSVRVRSTKR